MSVWSWCEVGSATFCKVGSGSKGSFSFRVDTIPGEDPDRLCLVAA